jgi:hypothetical protein
MLDILLRQENPVGFTMTEKWHNLTRFVQHALGGWARGESVDKHLGDVQLPLRALVHVVLN